MTETEKKAEKSRVLYRKGGIHSSEYTFIHNASRYERILKSIFYDSLVWVTVKGKRRLGRVQRTYMKFLKTDKITGTPIFDCDVMGLESKKVFRLNSSKYNIELDGEIPDELTYEQIEEWLEDNEYYKKRD